MVELNEAKTILQDFEQWRARKANSDLELGIDRYIIESEWALKVPQWDAIYTYAAEEFNTDDEVGWFVRNLMDLLDATASTRREHK